MNAKSIVIKVILGVLLTAVLILGICFLSQPEKEIKEEPVSVYNADESRVIRVEADGYTLFKEDGMWVMEGFEDIPVNKPFTDALVKSLCTITSPMEMDSGEDYSAYGLGDDAMKITIVFDDDNKEDILIGNSSGDYRYVKTGSGEKVYIVKNEDLYMLFLKKIKYLETNILTTDEQNITAITFGDVVLKKDGDNWFEVKPYEHPADADKIKVNILDKVLHIEAVDVLKGNEAELSGERKVLVESSEEKTELLLYDDNLVSVKGTGYVYEVDEEINSFADMSGFEFLNRYIAPIAISDVAEIKVISPSGETTLEIEEPKSEAAVFYKNGIESEESDFRAFYQGLMELCFVKEGKASGKSEYEIIFKKVSGEKVKIGFISASESEYAVAINGRTDFLIPKKNVRDAVNRIYSIKTR